MHIRRFGRLGVVAIALFTFALSGGLALAVEDSGSRFPPPPSPDQQKGQKGQQGQQKKKKKEKKQKPQPTTDSGNGQK